MMSMGSNRARASNKSRPSRNLVCVCLFSFESWLSNDILLCHSQSMQGKEQAEIIPVMFRP